MSPRSKLTAFLAALAVLAGTALSLGVGRPPRGENEAILRIREEAAQPGRKLYRERKCLVCHGDDGGGAAMGPAIGPVIPEYLREAGGDREAARDRLVRYLKDPKGVPTLRKDPTKYPNPMPSAEGLGIEEAELRALAEFVLSLQSAPFATGGGGQGR